MDSIPSSPSTEARISDATHTLASLPSVSASVWIQAWTSSDESVDLGTVSLDITAMVLRACASFSAFTRLYLDPSQCEDARIAKRLWFDGQPHVGPFVIQNVSEESLHALLVALAPHHAWPTEIDDVTEADLDVVVRSALYATALAAAQVLEQRDRMDHGEALIRSTLSGYSHDDQMLLLSRFFHRSDLANT